MGFKYGCDILDKAIPPGLLPDRFFHKKVVTIFPHASLTQWHIAELRDQIRGNLGKSAVQLKIRLLLFGPLIKGHLTGDCTGDYAIG